MYFAPLHIFSIVLKNDYGRDQCLFIADGGCSFPINNWRYE